VLREVLKTKVLEEGNIVIKTLKTDFSRLKDSVDTLVTKNASFRDKI
jgi:hypothetical protein